MVTVVCAARAQAQRGEQAGAAGAPAARLARAAAAAAVGLAYASTVTMRAHALHGAWWSARCDTAPYMSYATDPGVSRVALHFHVSGTALAHPQRIAA